MYANRFASERRFHPASMGVALAINGGLLAAMLMAGSVTVIPYEDPVLNTTAIPLPPVPPEVKPEPQPVEKRAEPQPQPLTFLPKPVVDLPRPDQPVLASESTLPITPPTMTGTPGGTGTSVSVDPPKPMPVLVDATPDPRYSDAFQPAYPPAERRAERDGVVTVRVRIDASGRVTAVEPVRATSDAFLEATRRQALSKWRFRAATRDGVPVESWRVMTVRFEMEN
ncbi:energy transducer TonB [Sphingomonas desiccabilis]|uniref:Energy transducer TonB n=1 Tax=Sphingomonas desiccabilis TaxID=429134 RepID=A0A4V1QNR0_9SPHN|nr:energy transducer TonB [Sphingomonas desiccabilis]MBB3912127.1 protein TonB [Sphingomonas desiccabilis]RXZ30291.1 energy transducer TonB [Sphingomonas desiccabilis]